MNYLLDTNILLLYLRENRLTHALESSLNLLSGDHNILISVVTVGEIKSIAEQNNWGEKKKNVLCQILEEFLIVDINIEEIINKYAEIDTFSQGKMKGKSVSFSSRNMGKNDLWIAATASVYNLRLVTTDQDFVHLANEYVDLMPIDLANYR